MLQAVIFDRDGILLDSEDIHIQSTLYALKKFGINPELSDTKLIVGRHPSDYTSDFIKKYAQYNISYDNFRKFQKDFYYEHIDNAPIFEDAINLVKTIHTVNILLGLATSSSKDNTIRFLDRSNLKDYFDAIITCDDCTKRKPEPDPYLITANKLNVDAKHCVAIEDTSIGIESAKRAGMKCIAIPNKYTLNEDFSKADLIVTSAKDINLQVLQNLTK